MTAAEILRVRLRALKVKPKDLVKALGVKPSQASLMLSGKRGIRTTHLDAIAAYVKLSVPELFMVSADGSVASSDELETAQPVRTGKAGRAGPAAQGLLGPDVSPTIYDPANLAETRAQIERLAADLTAVAMRLPGGPITVARRPPSGDAPSAQPHRRPPNRPPRKKRPHQ